MARFLAFLIFTFYLFHPAYAESGLSASRDINTDYSFYAAQIGNTTLRTPLSSSRPYDEASLPKATSWGSLEMMQERFEFMRDARFLKWKKYPNKHRRNSWNYPDDGCFARASLTMRNFSQWAIPLPHKVFVFGNLLVRTPNSPRGVVSWWYHVAPIIEVGGMKFVIDPSIDLSRPLQLKEWLMRMGKPEKMKLAICGPGTYSPKDNCNKASDGRESGAENALQTYLDLEWERMVKLGRESEL